MKGYCFFVFPLLHCFSFCDFFFCLCLDCFQTGTRQRGGVVREDGTALQYTVLLRLFPGISLLTYQRGDTVLVFVLQEWEKNKRQWAIRMRPFIQKVAQGEGTANAVAGAGEHISLRQHTANHPLLCCRTLLACIELHVYRPGLSCSLSLWACGCES